jgi:hypothetical protein
MKPDSPDQPPEGSTKPAAPTGNETQVIDLADVEVLVAQHNLESQRQLDAHGPPSLPPPLPASELARAPMSVAPAEPPVRGNAFYIVAILAFLVIGIGGGLAVAKTLSKPAPAPAPPAHSAGGAAVITIPTVEMNDADSGTK